MKRSSGMKRGLAVSAISALAFAGLAITPASAQTIAGSGTPLTLYSQYNGQATSNGTVTLLAGMPTSIGPNVNHARFSFSPDGVTWTNIGGPIVPTDGVATLEWAAPVGTWDVRVQAFDNGNNVLDTDITPGVVVDANNPSADFSNALFANVGQWGDEIVVRGTIADGTDIISVSAQGPEAVTPSNGATIAPGPGTFVGVVDLGINNTGDATDQVVIGAEPTDFDFLPFPTTDDVSVVTVYDQIVNNVTKTLAAGSTMNVVSGSGDDTTYVLHAVDQNGADIQGLDFYESNAAGLANDGNGQPLNGETDVDGNAEVTLNEADIDNGTDLDPAANAQLTYYVVDVNENTTYENGTDWLFEVRQTRFSQVATTVEISNDLGDVMDDDENSTVTYLVKDQFGNPMPGATVRAKVDHVGHTPTEDPAGAYADLGVTGPDGKLTVPFSAHNSETEVVTFNAFVNNDGDPNPTAGDAIATPYVIDTDETEVLWDDGNKAQALVGSTPTFNGSLVQENTGNPMPDRPLDIDYASGLGSPGNSILAPQADQPAGTIRGSDTEANVTTGADGTFGVAVTDPVPPDGQELGAELDVSSNSLPNGLDAENDPQTLEIDFLRSITPDRVRIINPVTGDETDGLQGGVLGPDLRPGGLGIGEVEVENSDGILLSDVDVNVTIDEGHFVDIFDTPFEPGAPGDPLDWQNDGQAITVTTDDGGSALFVANIERNAGFDDDGLVDDDLSASAGPASDVHDLTWSTNNVPLNPRATDPLVVELSADQESSILPKARAGNVEDSVDSPGCPPVCDGNGNGQVVDYDVSTWDQFGNPTAQPTTTTDNTPVADFAGGGQSNFALGQPSIQAFADSATNQSLEVELDGSIKVTYQDDPETSEFDPNNPGLSLNTDPVQVETNTAAINWYDVNYDASSFTLRQQGPNTVPVGSAVTEVLTAKDQEGQPLENLPVDFLRGGPGNEDDDSCLEDNLNACLATDASGRAFYDFVGGSAGTATITAVVYEPIVDGGTRIGTFGPDTVTFGGGQVAINARLSGKSKGNKDILKVNAPSKAAGAKVRLQKKTANGWKQLGAAKTLNSLGNKTFKVRDRNGNKVTKYRAKVSPTSDTKGDTTNVVRQR